MLLLVLSLFGEKSKLDDETKTAFQDSSLSHMIAISGAHVGIVLGVLNWLGRKCAKRLWKMLLLVFLVVFSIFVGGSPSVIRACVGAELSLLASLCYRKADALNNLGISLCILIFLNPFCILDVGLQLSYLRCSCHFANGEKAERKEKHHRKGKSGSKTCG